VTDERVLPMMEERRKAHKPLQRRSAKEPVADVKEKLRVRVRNAATDKFGNRAAPQLVALAKEERYSESKLVAIRKRMSSADFKQA
jgi:hypothetical protein